MADPVIESASVETPAQQGPTLKERVNALTGEARDHWQMHGDLEGAEELLKPKSDDTSASSPDKPSVDSEEPEIETASEPVAEEQPKAGETPEQKSERKHRNDQRRWEKLTREAAENKARADLLERQLAEKAASAPAKTPEAKPVVTDKPKRPRLSDYDTVDKYEAAMDAYEEAREVYSARQIDGRLQTEKQADLSAKRQATWGEQVNAAKTKYKDFEAVAFSAQTPASDAMIHAMQGSKEGAEIAYYLGQHRDVAARIAKASDLPPNATPYQQGKADALVEMEFARIAESLAKPKATPPKQIIANQPRPSGEVAVENRGAPVEDELEDAIRRKDQAAYRRIMNKRDAQEVGA